MSYTPSVHFIVGVRLSNLFSNVETKTETKPLFDELSGKPNGDSVDINRKYGTLPNGTIHEIGNNFNKRKEFKLDFSAILPDENEIDIHKTSYESLNLMNMIYGIEINDFGGNSDVQLITSGSVKHQTNRAANYLKNKFGYTGEIQMFTMLKHN